MLKNKGVDVFFENEGLHSIDGNDELLISLMEAIAQAESESRGQNIKWGIKQQAQNPDAPIYSRPCYGYRTVSLLWNLLWEFTDVFLRVLRLYFVKTKKKWGKS
ncbi:MAG: recombinase family protein [Eubacteriales bacterium]|nr:recombinase family protein [Eubacteriales bacterium]